MYITYVRVYTSMCKYTNFNLMRIFLIVKMTKFYDEFKLNYG